MPASARLNIAAVATLALAVVAALSAPGRSALESTGAVVRTKLAEAASARATPPVQRNISLPEERLRQFVGYYRRGDGQALSTRIAGGQLMVSLDDHSWSRLSAVSPARFRVDGSLLEIEFDARPGQRANAVALRDGGSTSLLLRAVDPGAAFAGVPFFLRGSMNQWDASQRMLEAGAHHYTATMALSAGLHEFKLGSADWQAVDFGSAAGIDVVVPGQKRALAAIGANLKLQIEHDGTYRFTLDASNEQAPVIAVTEVP